MKKNIALFVALMLILAMFAGCGRSQAEVAPTVDNTAAATAEPTAAPTAAPTDAPTEPAEEEDIVYEGDASSYYIDVAYHDQIARYVTPLTEKWNEDQYLENGLCEVLAAYYEGNPLENVGYGFVDLDNDGRWELVIGAIADAEDAPAVFEIWTLVDGKPVMLAQAGARVQYTLQYVPEDGMWYVVNENSSGAYSNATYYLMLNEGKFEVVQGILYDKEGNGETHWFMTYDMDWEISNDMPIDEDTAYSIRESQMQYYIALEYFPYFYFN